MIVIPRFDRIVLEKINVLSPIVLIESSDNYNLTGKKTRRYKVNLINKKNKLILQLTFSDTVRRLEQDHCYGYQCQGHCARVGRHIRTPRLGRRQQHVHFGDFQYRQQHVCLHLHGLRRDQVREIFQNLKTRHLKNAIGARSIAAIVRYLIKYFKSNLGHKTA